MKYALVTGASRGLGKGFVDHLLSEGYFVFAGARHITERPDNPNLEYIELDVTSDASINQAYEKVSAKTNHLDLLVNNAGVNKRSATGEQPELVNELKSLDRDKLLYMFNVNSVSPIMMTKKFSTLMTSENSFVVNVSSCRASFHDPFDGTNANYGYRASKLALNMFILASIKDLPKNIKIFGVHPGNVHTDMNPKGEDDPLNQAKMIVGITNNWKDEYNGAFLNYDGEFFPL